MHHKRIALLVVMLAGCLFPAQTFALDTPTPTFVQAMVGAAQFSEDDLTFSEISTTDGTVTSDNDLSTMPYLGMALQYPFHGENTQVGLDGSFLFGWRSKDTTVRGGSGQIAISVDSSLWLADLSVGLFVKHTFFNRWRTYAAVGPAVVFGEYSEDTDEEDSTNEINEKNDNSDSEFGVGAYARAGFDYLFGPNAYVGVCVRGLKTNIAFDSAPDASSSLSGVQGFLTFSRHF
jgi:opacity protein-like surface antigen